MCFQRLPALVQSHIVTREKTTTTALDGCHLSAMLTETERHHSLALHVKRTTHICYIIRIYVYTYVRIYCCVYSIVGYPSHDGNVHVGQFTKLAIAPAIVSLWKSSILTRKSYQKLKVAYSST